VKTLAATLGLVLLLGACAGSQGGSMPAGDHVHSLAVTGDNELLLGLHGGLYRSADGQDWDLAGLSGEDAMAIVAAGSPVFVAGHEVLYRSDDGGQTFTPLTPPDLPGLDVHGFAQSPSNSEHVYAYVVGHGVFFSGDAGESWESRSTLASLPPDVIALAATGPDGEGLLIVGPESGIHHSDDGGRTFHNVSETPAGAVAVDMQSPEVVWALTANGLERSKDAGVSWEIASRLDGVGGQPAAMAVDGDHVWLVTEQPRALHQSKDGGETWQRVAGA
jgi:photosystem II stability/assembly factor-like uncharacterized protein